MLSRAGAGYMQACQRCWHQRRNRDIARCSMVRAALQFQPAGWPRTCQQVPEGSAVLAICRQARAGHSNVTCRGKPPLCSCTMLSPSHDPSVLHHPGRRPLAASQCAWAAAAAATRSCAAQRARSQAQQLHSQLRSRVHTGVPLRTASRSFFTSLGSVPSPCKKRLQGGPRLQHGRK